MMSAITSRLRARSSRAATRRSSPWQPSYGLPVAWIGTIPLATHGGGLITGAYWMVTSLLVLGTERVGLTAATTTTA